MHFPSIMAAGALVLAACTEQPARPYEPSFGSAPRTGRQGPEYSFGVFPLHNAVRLFEVYDPLVQAANATAEGFSLRLEGGRDYPAFERKLRARELAFAIVNPYQALAAERAGYRIFAKMGDDARMRGMLVVRKDSGVKSLEDLRGASISFPARTAAAATMMNKVFLRRHGIDAEQDMRPTYVGSQDSAIVSVFAGLSKVGGTWPPAWEAIVAHRPEVAAALEVLSETEPLVNLAVIARDDVPEAHVAAVAHSLLSLGRSEEGRRVLGTQKIPGYQSATSSTYAPAQDFFAEYTQLFGALPEEGD